MKLNKKSFFNFDHVMLIDGNQKFSEDKLRLLSNNKGEKFLGATFNHRLFNLNQKSTIKSELEYLNINHLMFSIRPSFKKIFTKQFKIKSSFYKDFFQIYFCIVLCLKYKINSIILDDNIKKRLSIPENINAFIKNNLNLILKKLNKEDKKITFFKILNLQNIKLDNIKITYLRNQDKNKRKINIIPKNEKDLFWLGFDERFKDAPLNKKYKKDIWQTKKDKSKFGKPIFENLKYCSRCCLPETSEGIKFDEYGICTICRSSEEKMNIDWSIRENKLKNIFTKYKKNKNYDCLLPTSGGKDSMFQSYVLKNVYKLNPLCVTHSQNWLSTTGRFNLENSLFQFDLDHLIFIPSRNIVNKVAKKSVHQIGDACWHCHIGAGSISIQTSVVWDINLIVFGEAPADTDSRGQHKKIIEISPYRFLDESAIKKYSAFADKKTTKKDLSHWAFPNKEEIKQSKTMVIHLGQYIFWDEHKNIDLVSKKFGWRSGKVENTYKTYKSVECVMAGVHDYFNFIKRGIGRATIHASEDVRRGLITREKGFELAKEYDVQKPHALKYYMKITNQTENQILNALKKSRKKSRYASKIK